MISRHYRIGKPTEEVRVIIEGFEQLQLICPRAVYAAVSATGALATQTRL